jgi:hypothetical protein
LLFCPLPHEGAERACGSGCAKPCRSVLPARLPPVYSRAPGPYAGQRQPKRRAQVTATSQTWQRERKRKREKILRFASLHFQPTSSFCARVRVCFFFFFCLVLQLAGAAGGQGSLDVAGGDLLQRHDHLPHGLRLVDDGRRVRYQAGSTQGHQRPHRIFPVPQLQSTGFLSCLVFVFLFIFLQPAGYKILTFAFLLILNHVVVVCLC